MTNNKILKPREFLSVSDNRMSKRQLETFLRGREYSDYKFSSDRNGNTMVMLSKHIENEYFAEKAGIIVIMDETIEDWVAEKLEEYCSEKDQDHPGVTPAPNLVRPVNTVADFAGAFMSLQSTGQGQYRVPEPINPDSDEYVDEDVSNDNTEIDEQEQQESNMPRYYDEMSLKIDADVPIPPSRGPYKKEFGIRKSVFWSLKVNQSVFIAGKTTQNLGKPWETVEKTKGWAFTTRTVVEDGIQGVRVWRIKSEDKPVRARTVKPTRRKSVLWAFSLNQSEFYPDKNLTWARSQAAYVCEANGWQFEMYNIKRTDGTKGVRITRIK